MLRIENDTLLFIAQCGFIFKAMCLHSEAETGKPTQQVFCKSEK